jgi:meso-butanediol dehydrogenase / (S,S)-butanediol dehydrogenase / diacetyl reductase
MRLEGATALVTGGGRGIGRAIATALARAGARVAVADLGAEAGRAEARWGYALAGRAELEATTEALRAAGGEALAVELDVTREASCREAVASTVAAFGTLDLLVNAAGVIEVGPVAAFPEAAWDRILAVNAKGPFLMAQAAIPALTDGGAIVSVSSVCGKAGFGMIAAYCASKFALLGLTQSLAHELAPRGIRANAVCPGLVATAMVDHLEASGVWGEQGFSNNAEERERALSALVPLGRSQLPEEVAEAVLFLATAPSVTGVALSVSGGQLMG